MDDNLEVDVEEVEEVEEEEEGGGGGGFGDLTASNIWWNDLFDKMG